MELRRGKTGENVNLIQDGLKALGLYSGKVDGVFGPNTERAVVEFQRRFFATGIADDHTIARIVDEAAQLVTKIVATDFLITRPHGLAEIKKTFGVIRYAEAGNGRIAITNNFEAENIVRIRPPVIGRRVPVHKKLADVFTRTLQQIEDEGIGEEIEQFGTWSPRHKMHNPRKGLSTHSWGIACDVNWATNQPGTAGTLTPELVKIFEANGFEWGGRWSKKDPMHFAYATGY